MITSKINASAVLGFTPVGWTPLTPNNSGNLAYISASNLTGVFDFLVSDLTYVPNDILATQLNFLTLVKTYLDTIYMPSVFTDIAVSYDARYIITNIQLVFENANNESGTSIWTERVYKYKTTLKIQVNVD